MKYFTLHPKKHLIIANIAAVIWAGGCACNSSWSITNRTNEFVAVLAVFPTTGHDPRSCGPREIRIVLGPSETWLGPDESLPSYRWYEYATGRPHIAVQRLRNERDGYWVSAIEDGESISVEIYDDVNGKLIVESFADGGIPAIATPADRRFVGNIIDQLQN